jgi:hypothetical protein
MGEYRPEHAEAMTPNKQTKKVDQVGVDSSM